jgi:hypothetical protein
MRSCTRTKSALRERKDQRDRLDLRDIDQAIHVGRMNDVADIDLPDPGDAVDRRGEISIAEIDLGALDDRLIGFHHGHKLRHDRFLRIGKLQRNRFFFGEVGIAVEIDARIFKMRLVAVAIGDRLIELRLVGSRVDLAEQVALLDRLPLDEINLDQLAGNLAAHDHIVVGNDGADAAQIDRHVMAHHGSRDDAHRHRRRRCGRRWRLMPPRRACQGERTAGHDRGYRDHC